MSGLARALKRGVRRQLGADNPQYFNGLSHLWYAKDHLQNYLVEGTRLRSRKGPDYAFSVAGPMYDDAGNSVGAIPVVHHDANGNIRGVWGGPAFTQHMPYSEPASDAAWTTKSDVSVVPASGGMEDFGDHVTVFGDNNVTRWAGQSIDNVATKQALSFLVKMDDGGAPEVGGDAVSGDFSIMINGAIELITASVQSIGAGIYKVVGVRSSTGTSTGFGIVKYTTQSARTFKVTRFNVTRTGFLMPYVKSVGSPVSVVSAAGTSGGNGTSLTLDAKMAAALTGKCTVAALTCIGASSAEIADDTYPSFITVTSGVSSIAYSAKAGGVFRVNAYDGVTLAPINIGTGIARDTLLLFCMQTNTAGTKFRVGYRRYNLDKTPIDSSITWSSWVAFDGSFNPTTFLRWFLNATTPNWMRAVAIWDKGAIADSEILKRMEAA